MNWPCLWHSIKLTLVFILAICAAGGIGMGFGYLITHDRIKTAIGLVLFVGLAGCIAFFYEACSGGIQ
jgi:hypothetical protein